MVLFVEISDYHKYSMVIGMYPFFFKTHKPEMMTAKSVDLMHFSQQVLEFWIMNLFYNHVFYKGLSPGLNLTSEEVMSIRLYTLRVNKTLMIIIGKVSNFH